MTRLTPRPRAALPDSAGPPVRPGLARGAQSGPRRGQPGRGRALRLGLLLALGVTTLTTLAGCRAFDRRQLALGEMVRLPESERRLATYERMAGANPQLGPLWMQTVYLNPAVERIPPEQALENARRGRRFVPASMDLAVAEADWAARSSDVAAARGPLEDALAAGPPEIAASLVRSRLIETLLELGQPEEAEAQTLRLSGSSHSTPPQRASAWAGVALAYELVGEREAADRAMAASLHQHPTGLERLAEVMMRRPEQGAASRALRARAADAFPWHPDVQLQHAGDLLAAQKRDDAEARLSALPDALPARLQGAREVLRARLQTLRGDPAAGAATLLARLDQRPDDLLALQALILVWQEHDEPERNELLRRIYAFVNHDHPRPLPTELRRGLITLYEQIRKSAPGYTEADDGEDAAPADAP